MKDALIVLMYVAIAALTIVGLVSAWNTVRFAWWRRQQHRRSQ